MSRYRRWCFTVNNPSIEEMAKVKSLECRYVICGVEKGEQGTLHLQGYVEFETAKRLGAVKEAISNRAHLEGAKGSGQQNKEYCSKEGDIFEKGKMAQPGKRNDIDNVREIILDGGNMRDVAKVATSGQSLRAAEMLMKYIGPERKVAPEIKWYYGKSGTGKTRLAVEEAGEDYWMSSRGLKWWDGYDGQTNVILDDFRGDFCTFHELLRILDRYPFRVEVKGGSRMLMAEKIWITAPVHPRLSYTRGAEEIEQLLRRINVIREFGTEVQRSGVILDPDLEETKS